MTVSLGSDTPGNLASHHTDVDLPIRIVGLVAFEIAQGLSAHPSLASSVLAVARNHDIPVAAYHRSRPRIDANTAVQEQNDEHDSVRHDHRESNWQVTLHSSQMLTRPVDRHGWNTADTEAFSESVLGEVRRGLPGSGSIHEA